MFCSQQPTSPTAIHPFVQYFGSLYLCALLCISHPNCNTTSSYSRVSSRRHQQSPNLQMSSKRLQQDNSRDHQQSNRGIPFIIFASQSPISRYWTRAGTKIEMADLRYPTVSAGRFEDIFVSQPMSDLHYFAQSWRRN